MSCPLKTTALDELAHMTLSTTSYNNAMKVSLTSPRQLSSLSVACSLHVHIHACQLHVHVCQLHVHVHVCVVALNLIVWFGGFA